MARPREFDRDAALDAAMRVFWAKGFAATSTDDLLEAMGIGRQSLYNAFGDKRALYIEALRAYQRQLLSGHLDRLGSPSSPIDGIRNLLRGLVAEDEAARTLGCMGVGSVSEFGITDPELVAQRLAIGLPLHERIVKRIVEGQAAGEIKPSLNPQTAAQAVQIAMSGIQVAARSGAGVADLHAIADFIAEQLT